MTATAVLPHPKDVALGARIRLLRRLAGISQERVAQQIGVAFQQLQKYENGTNRIAVSRMFEIAECLGMSAMDLIAPLDDKAHSTPITADYMKLLQQPLAMEMLAGFSALSPAARKALIALMSQIS